MSHVASAKVQFGGPRGETLDVQAGDVVVLPAGVGHCRMDKSADLLIVGAYPDNTARPDQHRGDPAEHDAVVRNIAASRRRTPIRWWAGRGRWCGCGAASA